LKIFRGGFNRYALEERRKVSDKYGNSDITIRNVTEAIQASGIPVGSRVLLENKPKLYIETFRNTQLPRIICFI